MYSIQHLTQPHFIEQRHCRIVSQALTSQDMLRGVDGEECAGGRVDRRREGKGRREEKGEEKRGGGESAYTKEVKRERKLDREAEESATVP